ncbi:YybH family protein [Vineibacter terrae]|uniref:YybH family protein n=1 Tax=Vineibacter terrae TaxID=2586908 RepID=UPI002E321F92|nr:nuclear transport factor 2 family protein [Vineibacter terrae]HEX2889299.1 nuclear transport factor 2 family protein [Vineibacter terrae]
MLALTTMLVALPANRLVAQQPSDVQAVKAASKTFYSTLSVLDDGSAMERVWARTSYVTYVGPQSKSVIVGWDAQKQYWGDFNKRFTQRTVSLVDDRVHINGNLAWEIGVETGQAHMKDGTIRKVDWIVTNVYEKLGGQWLMVSHHVQPRPQ